MTSQLKIRTPLSYFLSRLRKSLHKRAASLMLFGLGLVIAAGIIVHPADSSDQATTSLHIVPAVERVLPPEPPQQAPTIVKDSESTARDSLPSPTPTPLPIPDIGVVWGGKVTGVYLWESPAGQILAHLPNGTQVQFLEERSSYGNLPWIKVRAPIGAGWLLQTKVFREKERPSAYIAAEDGTYLRDRPRGAVQRALSQGTPVMNILARRESEGRTWAQVKVVDGTVGWMPEEWLSTEIPVNGSGE